MERHEGRIATIAVDTTDFRAIHTSLRLGGRALALAAGTIDPADRRRTRALRRYWEGYAGAVRTHHTVDDEILYPALVERAPVAAEHLGRIEADHHVLAELRAEGDVAIQALVDGASPGPAAYVLRHLEHVMHVHLDDEDADLVPLFARHFDQADYDALAQAAAKTITLRQARFTFPFVGSWVSPEVSEVLLGAAPRPFRVLCRLTKGAHGRLARRVLDDGRKGRLEPRLLPV
jgi:hemerythrin-like domain-containing protein